MTAKHVVSDDATETWTDSKSRAKSIVTTLIEKRKPFEVQPLNDATSWMIYVHEENWMPGAMGRWMDGWPRTEPRTAAESTK